MQISSCWVYPIKSIQGFQVPTLVFDQKGPIEDRRFMLVDEKGKFITQRQKNQLSQVKLTRNNDDYLLLAPDSNHQYRLKKAGNTGEKISSTVWNDQLELVDQGQEAAEFFSAICGQSVRLVYQSEECVRHIDPNYDDGQREVSLADGFPLLLINQASLDKISEDFGSPLVIERFRPNIVVSGIEPFAEDNWHEITIGDQVFEVAKPCSRCVIPTIDPDTGIKDPAVWQTLKQHCAGEDGKIYFGQNLIPKNKAAINVGDSIEINC